MNRHVKPDTARYPSPNELREGPNLEHVDLLKSGSKNWNKWRENNPSIWPNFICADLQGVDLSKVNNGSSLFYNVKNRSVVK